jgi:hypothetical protein
MKNEFMSETIETEYLYNEEIEIIKALKDVVIQADSEHYRDWAKQHIDVLIEIVVNERTGN